MTPLTGDENVHYQAAQHLAADRRLAEALEEYTAALESEPTHLKAICGRGLALQSLGRHPEAIEEFDRSLVLKRDWAGAFIVHYARASSLYVQREFAESITACNEALLIDPAT
jgi:tetratricopeptide (TPR) repeat protein